MDWTDSFQAVMAAAGLNGDDVSDTKERPLYRTWIPTASLAAGTGVSTALGVASLFPTNPLIPVGMGSLTAVAAAAKLIGDRPSIHDHEPSQPAGPSPWDVLVEKANPNEAQWCPIREHLVARVVWYDHIVMGCPECVIQVRDKVAERSSIKGRIWTLDDKGYRLFDCSGDQDPPAAETRKPSPRVIPRELKWVVLNTKKNKSGKCKKCSARLMGGYQDFLHVRGEAMVGPFCGRCRNYLTEAEAEGKNPHIPGIGAAKTDPEYFAEVDDLDGYFDALTGTRLVDDCLTLDTVGKDEVTKVTGPDSVIVVEGDMLGRIGAIGPDCKIIIAGDVGPGAWVHVHGPDAQIRVDGQVHADALVKASGPDCKIVINGVIRGARVKAYGPDATILHTGFFAGSVIEAKGVDAAVHGPPRPTEKTSLDDRIDDVWQTDDVRRNVAQTLADLQNENTADFNATRDLTRALLFDGAQIKKIGAPRILIPSAGKYHADPKDANTCGACRIQTGVADHADYGRLCQNCRDFTCFQCVTVARSGERLPVIIGDEVVYRWYCEACALDARAVTVGQNRDGKYLPRCVRCNKFDTSSAIVSTRPEGVKNHICPRCKGIDQYFQHELWL